MMMPIRNHASRGAVLIALLSSLVAWSASALDIAVVASKEIALEPVSDLVLSRIFLKKLGTDKLGETLAPVNLPPTHPVRIAFSREVLRESAKASARYWNKQYFLGTSPPFVLNSQEAVLRFVTDTPGGIGYVLDCLADKRVNIIYRVSVSMDLEDKLAPFCEQSDNSPINSIERPQGSGNLQ
ncbi:MAG: hypothetical protein DSZ32_02360 [Gammaproteobacteria bacterium]|nr:MAG: hypothetical protein DSZ32_02360 [Gammaproteobacteria bacterium]